MCQYPHSGPKNVLSYPIVYLAMSNRVVDTISGPRSCGQRFIANEEVQVLGAALPVQVTTRAGTTGQERGLVRDGRTS